MQGKNTRQLATYLGFARRESSHKAASEGKSSSVRARLVGGVKVDRTAVDYDYEHTKLATRLDHGHELN